MKLGSATPGLPFRHDEERPDWQERAHNESEGNVQRPLKKFPARSLRHGTPPHGCFQSAMAALLLSELRSVDVMMSRARLWRGRIIRFEDAIVPTT
jgi:hypothetical protein